MHGAPLVAFALLCLLTPLPVAAQTRAPDKVKKTGRRDRPVEGQTRWDSRASKETDERFPGSAQKEPVREAPLRT